MRRFLLFTMSVLLMLTLAVPASAERNMARDAAGTTTFTVIATCDFPAAPGGLDDCPIDANGVVAIGLSNPGSKVGTFRGNQLYEGNIYINLAAGTFTIDGTVTFTGTVRGCGFGTVVFDSAGSGYLDPATGAANFDTNLQTIVASGTTLPITGYVNETGIQTPPAPDGSSMLDYSGRYTCDRRR